MTEADEELIRAFLKMTGTQPHRVEQLVREAKEEETDAAEVLKYVRQIMGRTEHCTLVLARALVLSFREEFADKTPIQLTEIVETTTHVISGAIRATAIQIICDQAIKKQD